METTIKLVGFLFTLPFIAIEAVIKCIMLILYYPMVLIIAIIYPLVKSVKKELMEWSNRWWHYATTWKRGFYSGYINKLWSLDD